MRREFIFQHALIIREQAMGAVCRGSDAPDAVRELISRGLNLIHAPMKNRSSAWYEYCFLENEYLIFIKI
ncbi:MAG: hypothetical protein AB1499_06790 [Nitrospirota bacterium]